MLQGDFLDAVSGALGGTSLFLRRGDEGAGRGFDRLGPNGGVSGFEPARAAEHGFTLIEIMVALAVFSLAALALVRLEGATLRSIATLDATLIAQMVARNVAIEAVTSSQPPALGRASGSEANGGRNWGWTREVRATGDERVLRVDVAVIEAGGTGRAQITMIRPPAASVSASAL